MLLTMASSMVSPPMTVSGDGSLRYTNEFHIFDTHSNEEKELKLDFILRTYAHYATPSGPITVEVQISDDVDFTNYDLITTRTQPYISLGGNGWKEAGHTIRETTTKRYLRIIVTSASGIQYPECYNIGLIDEKFFGGTASLSFELQGVNEQWFTILDSSELGAITQGDAKLIQYSITGIPPSQSRFKAVLKVIGALQTGVTVDLVA